MKKTTQLLIASTAFVLGACAPSVEQPNAKAPTIYNNIVLSAANEVPPVASTALGRARAVLNGNQLSVRGSFEGLEGELFNLMATPAHIHKGADGEIGAVTFPLGVVPFDNLRSGEINSTLTLTDEQVETLEAGGYYINIHSEFVNSGELRGRIGDGQPKVTRFTSPLSGNSWVPPVETSAVGAATILLVDDTLIVTGTFDGLHGNISRVNGSAAHIHGGAVGGNGPIFANLEVEADAFNLNLRKGVFRTAQVLTPDQLAAFNRGNYYLDVHSTFSPEGELRAQLSRTQPDPASQTQAQVEPAVEAVPEAAVSPTPPAQPQVPPSTSGTGSTTPAQRLVYGFSLSGTEAVPSIETSGSGTVTAALDGNVISVVGLFDNLRDELYAIRGSPAYIYEGEPSENGKIVFSLTVSADADNRGGTFVMKQTLTEDQISVLRAGGYYISITTEFSPNGELRGQLTNN